MKKLALEDLRPENAKITVVGEEYDIRAFTLADKVWLAKRYKSQDRLQQIFDDMDMGQICVIIYHQLDERGQEAFAPYNTSIRDDEGEIIKEQKITGPMNLASKITGGLEAELGIFKSLLKTIGMSEPMLDELEKKEIEKLRAEMEEKKSEEKPDTSESTGQISSTA